MEKDAIIYARAKFEDIPQIVSLEKRVWGEGMLADEEKWLSRIEKFPEGVMMAKKGEETLGVIVGAFLEWNYPENFYPNWFEATDNGFIGNHSYDGDILYGVDMTVLPGANEVAFVLLKSVFELRKIFNKKGGIMGSRIPSLRDYVEKNKIEEVDEDLVTKVARTDPTVNFFIKGGFSWVGPKKDYFSPDYESMGWGLILDHF